MMSTKCNARSRESEHLGKKDRCRKDGGFGKEVKRRVFYPQAPCWIPPALQRSVGGLGWRHWDKVDEDEGSITVELIECGTFETTSNDVGASDWKGPGSQGSKWSERSDSGPGAYVQTGRSIKLVCHDDGPNNLQGCTVSAGHDSAPNTYCRDTYRLGTSDNADADGQLFRLQIHWVSTAPNAPNSPLEQSRALERQLAVGHEAGGGLQGGDEGDKGNIEQEGQLVVLTPRSSHGQADQGQESGED